MTYLVLKFLHVGSMFLATALAVGPIVVFVLILRSGDAATIRRVFQFAEPVSRAGGVAYGLGVVFGIHHGAQRVDQPHDQLATGRIWAARAADRDEPLCGSLDAAGPLGGGGVRRR